MRVYKFINRDISWLSFNERVLQEAEDKRVPLLERLKFLGIYSNNLDEFFKDNVASLKRLAGLEENALLKADHLEVLGDNPVEILKEINVITKAQHKRFNKAYEKILKELEHEKIFIVNEKQLTESQGKFVERYFKNKVRSSLVPIMLDEGKPFPKLTDEFIYLAVRLTQRMDYGKVYTYSLIPVPNNVPRFLILPQLGMKKYVILLDDVIRFNLTSIFNIFDFDKVEAYTIKVTRDAQLDVEDDLFQSLPSALQKSLKNREKGEPSRLVYDSEMPYKFQRYIIKHLGLQDTDAVIAGARYHNFKDFMGFPSLNRKDLLNPKLKALEHPHLKGRRRLIEAVSEKDVLLSFPYQTFDHVLDTLREAAIDPAVTAISATAYRVASDSNVMKALINAVQNGKEVTVVIELLASFDEASNIKWLTKLKDEGVKVIMGVSGLKVHSKLIFIEREIKGMYESICLISTGNFNEKTAKIYADHILMTAHKGINEEVKSMFDFYRMNYKNNVYKHLQVAPYSLRNIMLEQIDVEIEKAKKGLPCGIFFKMNSFLDKLTSRRLYKASAAGVPIRLIVRGMFAITPEIKGLSSNIKAISIVDKFLEHARVYIFGAKGEERVFMGSADLRSRNFDARIEVNIPIYDKKVRKQLVDLYEIQWKDNQKSRVLDPDQKNEYLKNSKPPLRAQDAMYEYLKEIE